VYQNFYFIFVWSSTCFGRPTAHINIPVAEQYHISTICSAVSVLFGTTPNLSHSTYRDLLATCKPQTCFAPCQFRSSRNSGWNEEGREVSTRCKCNAEAKMINYRLWLAMTLVLRHRWRTGFPNAECFVIDCTFLLHLMLTYSSCLWWMYHLQIICLLSWFIWRCFVDSINYVASDCGAFMYEAVVGIWNKIAMCDYPQEQQGRI